LSEDGNPTLETIMKVLKPLGLHLRIEADEREVA
jgi:DNA-binding phage protein